MNVLPVIRRELLAESRHPGAWWLRLQGGLAVIVVMIYLWTLTPLHLGDGGRLFNGMQMALFAAVWFFVPLMTADVISRERREGTLGLLFLTPLRPLDIVLAKGFVHTLRAAGMGLAAVPLLVVPVLLGGLGGVQVVYGVALIASSFLWATAAGLLASALNRGQQRALVWSLFFSGLFAWVFMVALGFLGYLGWRVLVNPGSEFRFLRAIESGLELEGLQLARTGIVANARVPAGFWHLLGGGMVILSVAGLGLCLALAARLVRRRWQEEPPSARRQEVERVLYAPRFATGLFRRWMRRQLERNPVGWLEQRSWRARLMIWIWLATLASFLSALNLSDQILFRYFNGFLRALSLFLAMSVGMTAAVSFQRERQSGVLELLLVSPLKPQQILFGRLKVIWGQFLPALALLIGGWFYVSHNLPWERAWFAPSEFDALIVARLLAAYGTLPVIGACFALRFRHHLAAMLATLGAGLFLPFWAPVLLQWTEPRLLATLGLDWVAFLPLSEKLRDLGPWGGTGLAIGLQLALAVRCWQLMVRNLVERRLLSQLLAVE